jgi:hypothetical protein
MHGRKEREHLEELCIDEKTILKWMAVCGLVLSGS